MVRTLCTLRGEGTPVDVHTDDTGRVWFLADADIDADGANGQFGKKPAYRHGNTGLDHLANAGYPTQSWWKDILVVSPEDSTEAYIQGPKDPCPGAYVSKTAYRFPGLDHKSAFAYVDSATVPYIVVPPAIINSVKGIVLGSRAQATNARNGRKVECVVADVGPRTKLGELSIAAAEALGIPSSPRVGGTNDRIVMYELWPDEQGGVNGVTYRLQRRDGTYV